MRNLPSFVEKLPMEITGGIRTYTGAHTVLFKPNVYVTEPMHTQEDYHFCIPSTHTPSVILENKEIAFGSGRFLAVNPYSRMALVMDRPVKTREYAALSVNKALVQRVASQMGFNQDVVFEKADNPCTHQIRQLMIIYEQEMEQNGDALMDETISTMIVAAILRRVRSNVRVQGEPGMPCRSYVEKGIEYMRAYYDSNITLGDISEAVNLSQYHFIRVFKQDTGKTPYEYLGDIRMERAKELLQREYPVSEAASRCGYINPAHFAAAFRKRFGVSPSVYKKNTAI